MKNAELLKLYEANRQNIIDIAQKCDGEMEGPFLTAPSAAYWDSDLRIAFVGQETKGWICHTEPALQMAQYSDFDLGRNYHSSPFWNVIRKIERALTGTEYCSAWLNLNRYDEHGESPTWENQKILHNLDFLLLEELKILEPHVTIFFTGPNYDWRLDKILNATRLDIPGISNRQFCEIESDKLSGLILRTYHPNYLRRSALEGNILSEIVGRVESWQSQKTR